MKTGIRETPSAGCVLRTLLWNQESPGTPEAAARRRPECLLRLPHCYDGITCHGAFQVGQPTAMVRWCPRLRRSGELGGALLSRGRDEPTPMPRANRRGPASELQRASTYLRGEHLPFCQRLPCFDKTNLQVLIPARPNCRHPGIPPARVRRVASRFLKGCYYLRVAIDQETANSVAFNST